MSVEARWYCPVCEPTADPVGQVLTPHYCARHWPAVDGSADQGVEASYLSKGPDAGGEVNRRWCDFFHRGKLTTEACKGGGL